MNKESQRYSLAALRELLTATFTAEVIEQFCHDRPLFRAITDEFAPGDGLSARVDKVIIYCEARLLCDELVKEVHKARTPASTLGRLVHLPRPLPDWDKIPEPGLLPPGSRVPYLRNALFTGRVEPLRTLARQLLYGPGHTAIVTQAVAGMGGVGKTQLAVEFAYCYGPYLHGVHWLNAAQPDAIASEVAACGLAMGLVDWPEKQPEQVARTLQVWSQGGLRLVILDNLEEVATAQEWLARLSCGTDRTAVRVLVTARRSVWPQTIGLVPLRLDVFDPEESLTFLRKYIPGQRVSDSDLKALAERLGHLPLALELAGRYVSSMPGLLVVGYVDRLRETLNDPAMTGWLTELGNPTGHDLDLAATFAMSWKRVTHTAARRVFAVASWCAPNHAIPDEILKLAVGLETDVYDEAVGQLNTLGLVKWELSAIGPMLHPLLAEFGRNPGREQIQGVREGEGEKALEALVQVLAKLSHEANMSLLPERFIAMRAHVEAAAIWAEEVGSLKGSSWLEHAGVLWNEMGVHCRLMADYPEARIAFKRATGLLEKVLGPNHPKMAMLAKGFGKMLRDLGDLAGARASFELALKIDEGAYGTHHPEVALDVAHLGGVLRDLEDLMGAQAAFERSLRINEVVYGPDHPSVATDVNDLGLVLRQKGDLAAARAAYERALKIDEHAYGGYHPDVARDLNNLAGVLRSLGDLEGARTAYEKALAIDEHVYGPGHPKVATRVNNLASVLRDLGDLAGAQVACKRALEIREKTFGREHPDTALTLWWLGALATLMGDAHAARCYLTEALSTLLKFLPPEHSWIMDVRRNLENLK